uniref:Exostosin GT47 domain-containing protein n=1 Tax=Chromera velia CCMP2878 TaxID=1169474 RepID=A0A0G4H1R6_9ALVE|eukprot:Cvel_24301.t1-p1 / transcript=Cvel_24301.t1 / gene=Cvel_24301 / organism=Chromera_velia_CCMP2878 / gene_product=hypothetical protein / transcript_product=hypothetical protein / location=Cvel_scaffold2609:12431-15482(+) / protein_length=465 / sequence_SO=supercontig / SO=protein_coding / is_pseudo=false
MHLWSATPLGLLAVAACLFCQDCTRATVEGMALSVSGGRDSKSEVCVQNDLDINPVSFYMYPPVLFSGYTDCLNERQPDFKHGSGPVLIRQLANHPWRDGPSDAEICIVPVLFDHLTLGWCAGTLEQHLLQARQVIEEEDARDPKRCRHVGIATNWRSTESVAAFRKYLGQMIFAMNSKGDGCTLLTPYLAYKSAAPPGLEGYGHNTLRWEVYTDRPSNQKEKRFLVEFGGQVKRKDGYEDRLALFNSTGEIPKSYIVMVDDWEREGKRAHVRACRGPDDTDRCRRGRVSLQEFTEIREHSRFSLFLRGDEPLSDRLFNAFASQVPVVAVFDESGDGLTPGGEEEKYGWGGDLFSGWLPFPDIIPWKDLLIVIDGKTFREDPAGALRSLESIPQEQLEKLQKQMKKYRPDIDIGVFNTRVASNLLRTAAKLLPGSCSITNVGELQFGVHSHSHKQHRDWRKKRGG